MKVIVFTKMITNIVANVWQRNIQCHFPNVFSTPELLNIFKQSQVFTLFPSISQIKFDTKLCGFGVMYFVCDRINYIN